MCALLRDATCIGCNLRSFESARYISRRFDALTASWLTPFRISKALGGNLALVMKLRRSRESSLKPDQDVLMRRNFDFNLEPEHYTTPPPLAQRPRIEATYIDRTITIIRRQTREHSYWQEILQGVLTTNSANANIVAEKLIGFSWK